MTVFSIQAPQYFSTACNTICKFFIPNSFYGNQTSNVILGTSVVKLMWFEQYVSQMNRASNSLQASTLSH